MKKCGPFILLAVILLIFAALIYWGTFLEDSKPRNEETGNIALVDSYRENARAPIFAALITIGSFLLTLKTVILQRLKEGFDTQKYVDLYLSHKVDYPDTPYYGSLNRLSMALAGSILLCFSSSFLQMSLGFICHASAVISCLYLAFLSVTLVLLLTCQMFLAHKEWLAKIEEERIKEILDTQER